jgi:hypothetical protein
VIPRYIPDGFPHCIPEPAVDFPVGVGNFLRGHPETQGFNDGTIKEARVFPKGGITTIAHCIENHPGTTYDFPVGITSTGGPELYFFRVRLVLNDAHR